MPKTFMQLWISGMEIDEPTAHERMIMSVVCFFFSSRGRHTRFDCDWSSDVCSSDLRFCATLVSIHFQVAGQGLAPSRSDITYPYHVAENGPTLGPVPRRFECPLLHFPFAGTETVQK